MRVSSGWELYKADTQIEGTTMMAQGYLDLLAGPELDSEDRGIEADFYRRGSPNIYICAKNVRNSEKGYDAG